MKAADLKDRCTMQSAQNADSRARFRLSLQKEDRFIAETVIDREDQDTRVHIHTNWII